MRVKEALALRDRLKTRLQDVHGSTICFHRNHEQHLKEQERLIFESPEYSRVPNWVASYLRGTDDMLRARWYEGSNSLLVWVLIGPDGRLFGPGNDDWLKESAEYKSSLTGKHAWRDLWEKGEFRAF